MKLVERLGLHQRAALQAHAASSVQRDLVEKGLVIKMLWRRRKGNKIFISDIFPATITKLTRIDCLKVRCGNVNTRLVEACNDIEFGKTALLV